MRKTLLSLCVVLAVAGCDGDNEFSDFPLAASGSMSAKLDGKRWFARDPDAFVRHGVLTVRGVDAFGVVIELEVPLIGAQTLRIQPASVTRASVSTGFARWRAVPELGDGFVTFTTLTGSRATGTFSFTAKPVDKRAVLPTLFVTNGQFDVTF